MTERELLQLQRLALTGDHEAAEALYIAARRRGDRPLLDTASKALVRARPLVLVHAARQHADRDRREWRLQRQRLVYVDGLGVAALFVGDSTESARDRAAALAASEPCLAARAAALAAERFVDALRAHPGRELESRVEHAFVEALGAAREAETAARAGQRPRREWLPGRRGRGNRGRRRTGRPRVLVGRASGIALLVHSGRVRAFRSGDCGGELHSEDGCHSLFLEAEQGDVAAVEVSSSAAFSPSDLPVVERASSDFGLDQTLVLVGPGYEHVRELLAARELLSPREPRTSASELEAVADQFLDAWQRTLSPSAANRTEHEVGALLLRLSLSPSGQSAEEK